MTILDRLTDLEKQPRARRYADEEYNLGGFRDWLATMRSPHAGRQWIHVAGTKGKGSTCAMIESILRAHGLRTGLFTSPHLNHFGERFRFDGKAWTAAQFEEALERIEPWLEQREEHPSMDRTWLRTVFEVLTAIAFREFRAANVEAGILEVGLGGRLDCTNVVDPRVCAITPIGLDHTHVLGTTIEEIAAEKAGILKRGVPAVAFLPRDERRKRAHAIIAAHAKNIGAPLFVPPPVEVLSASPRGQHVLLMLESGPVDVDLALAGDFQAQNFAVAARAAQLFLRESGRELDDEALRVAASSVDWPARLQLFPGPPALVIDSAHCPLSALALGRNLEMLAPAAPGPFVLLWGMNRDKDRGAFLANLLAGASEGAIREAICFRLPGFRASAPEELAELANDNGLMAHTVETAADALDAGMERAGRGSLLAAGSLYALTTVAARHAERLGNGKR